MRAFYILDPARPALMLFLYYFPASSLGVASQPRERLLAGDGQPVYASSPTGSAATNEGVLGKSNWAHTSVGSWASIDAANLQDSENHWN